MRISALELQNTAAALTREWIILGMETQWNSGQHTASHSRTPDSQLDGSQDTTRGWQTLLPPL